MSVSTSLCMELKTLSMYSKAADKSRLQIELKLHIQLSVNTTVLTRIRQIQPHTHLSHRKSLDSSRHIPSHGFSSSSASSCLLDSNSVNCEGDSNRPTCVRSLFSLLCFLSGYESLSNFKSKAGSVSWVPLSSWWLEALG